MIRRTRGMATATIALAVVLASCGEPPGPPPDEGAADPGADPSEQEPPSGTADGPTNGIGAELLAEEPADDGGVVRPYEWQLTGVSPDERVLHVSAFFGGVASGCNRWEGWEVAASADEVVIAARMWQDPDAEACTDEGNHRDHHVQLDEPLGDRDLIGCQQPDCRHGPLTHDASGGDADASGDVLVAWSPAGRFSLDPTDGAVRWHVAEPGAGWWHAADGLIVTHDGMETTRAVDPADGAEVWSTTGAPLGIVDDLVLTCGAESDADDAHRLTDAHDLATGTSRWSAEIGCGRDVATDGEVVVASGWRGESGPSELAALDPVDGAERWRTELGAAGGHWLAHADGRVFVDADDGIVAVDLADGSTTAVDVAAWSPIGAVDGTVFAIGDGEVVAFDARDGEVRWTEPIDDPAGEPTLVVDDGAVFVGDGDAGVVERRDPDDGEVVWRAEVGRTGRIGVAVHGEVAYAATSVAVVALDLDTGEQLWWAPLVPG